MHNRIEKLFQDNKLNHIEYLTYMLFVTNPLGHEYLKFVTESVLMEEPIGTNESFAWHDGRRSTWRDVKLIINHVNKILEGREDDRPEITGNWYDPAK